MHKQLSTIPDVSDILTKITGFLGPKGRASMAAAWKHKTLLDARQPDIKAIDAIQKAMAGPQLPCPAKLEALIVEYYPFSKRRVKQQLDIYIRRLNQYTREVSPEKEATLYRLLKRVTWTKENEHDCLTLLTTSPILVLTKNIHFQMPLDVAVSHGNDDAIKLLLAKGAPVNMAISSGQLKDIMPLEMAALGGDLTIVTRLLQAGAPVTAKNGLGNTPLHLAARRHHIDVTKTLLTAGADVDSRNNNGWTPLHEAAHNGHLIVADILLKAGANVSVKTNRGNTPFQLAESRYSEVSDELGKVIYGNAMKLFSLPRWVTLSHNP